MYIVCNILHFICSKLNTECNLLHPILVSFLIIRVYIYIYPHHVPSVSADAILRLCHPTVNAQLLLLALVHSWVLPFYPFKIPLQ